VNGFELQFLKCIESLDRQPGKETENMSIREIEKEKFKTAEGSLSL
jgi:hypothetical protein